MSRPGSLAGPVVVAMGLVAAAVAFAVVTTLLDRADGTVDLRLAALEATLAEARDEAAAQATDLEAVRADLARLREDVSLIANRPAPAPAPAAGALPLVGAGEDFEAAPTEAPTEEMKVVRERFNRGVTQPRNRIMLELLGPPRDRYSQDCQGVTNPRIASLLEERQLSPGVRVTMLRPALDSLQRVLDRLRESDPDIHAGLGTAGALCVRNIRGSSTSISNHSWGTAIDFTINGQLDPFADGGTQFALLLLAEYLNDEGWYWGAAYRREDSMHFEVGEETLRRWREEGLLGAPG